MKTKWGNIELFKHDVLIYFKAIILPVNKNKIY